MAKLTELERVRDRLAKLHARRDELIRELVASGGVQTEVAKAAGVTRMTVHRIVKSDSKHP